MTTPSIKEALELKPCPFCGGEAQLCQGIGGLVIQCNSEDCIGTVGPAYTEAQAAALWNTRATLSPPAGEIPDYNEEAIAKLRPDYVSDFARSLAADARHDIDGERAEDQIYYLARWFDAMVAFYTKPPPAGERREAIAARLRSCCGDDLDYAKYVPTTLLLEAAHLLASGLVQDEAAIRADEREKCAKIAKERAMKLRAKAKSLKQPHRQHYFAQAIEASIISDHIRSARDGGAES